MNDTTQSEQGEFRTSKTCKKIKENVTAVDEGIQENGSRSVRKLAVEDGISRESIRSIQKEDLSLKPNRIKTLLIKCKAYTSLKMLITVMLVL